MKFFIAYKYTGSDLNETETALKGIEQALEKSGHESYCKFASQKNYDEKSFDVKQIMSEAFSHLEEADAILAFVNSDQRSEGMLIEIGYAYAKGKRVVVAARKGSGVNTAKSLADKFIEFNDLEELYKELETLRM
jgi:nucleoside 2-deoxyribosyltransferase